MVKRVLAVLLVSLVVAPAAAEARPRVFLHTTERLPFASDGGRYLAYGAGSQGIGLYDSATGGVSYVRTGENCRLVGMSAGHALVACDQEEIRYPPVDVGTRGVLVDVRSRKVTTLPEVATWRQIGRQWAVGGLPDPSHPPQVNLVNWRTGETRFTNESDGPFDVDAAEPAVLAWPTLSIDRLPGMVVRLTKTVLTIKRSGKPARTIARGGLTFRYLSASRRLVSWSTPGRAQAYDLKRRRRLSWTVKPRTVDYVHVAHTDRDVFFEAPVKDGYLVYKVRLRR
jgi:hypothetical protein